MRRTLTLRLLLFLSIALLLFGCSSKPKTPQAEWNDLYIFAYVEDEDLHYMCTIDYNGPERFGTFKDFMNTIIFQDDAKIKWSKITNDTWRLTTDTGSQFHNFKLQRVVTPKGNEGIDIVTWEFDDRLVEGKYKIVNFHNLMKSKEYREYEKS